MEVLAQIVVVLVVILGAYLTSPASRGNRGERWVNAVLDRDLPRREYKVCHDITLDTSHGPTQIDHIVLSRYGVFVIETKNYSGWIFGSAKRRQWTQTIYGYKSRFQNPLHQNYKHVKAVESFFSLDLSYIHSVVVFVGNSEFKTDFPDNVTDYWGLCPYILSKKELLLGTSHVREMASRLDDHKAGRVPKTPTLTVIHDDPSCPKCGERMVRRTARKGTNVGSDFWGCPQFPRCRGVRKISIAVDSSRISNS